MSILISNATIVTQNQDRDVLCGDVYIEGDEIREVSQRSLSVEADYKVDATGKVVVPGLINTHTHVPMTLLRGYGDDMALETWLKECIWPVEANLDDQAVKLGMQLGLLEMIASGTTSFVDMYFFVDTIAAEAEKAGVRGFVGFPFLDDGTPEYDAEELVSECKRFIEEWSDTALITPMVAPHGTYTCSPDLLAEVASLAENYEVMVHTHCSETRDEVYSVQKQYNRRPVAHLEKQGLLNNDMLLAHCGWITKNEVREISKAGAGVSHCPVSNMKMGTGGFTPVPELVDAGVSVSLGTDGAASNNTLDMFETMKITALLHKHHRWDPQVTPAQQVLDFATLHGARVLRQEQELGSIEEGKRADVIVVDFNTPRLYPRHDVVSHLVYAARGTDVCTTIVNGEPLLFNRGFTTLQQDKIMDDAERCAQTLIK